MDNNKLIVLTFIILLVLCFVSYDFTKFFANNKIKYIEEIFGPEGFITVDNKMKGDQYNLTYGELTSKGMEQIVNYLETKNIQPSQSTFIDLGCGNGKTLAYATVYGFKQARGAEIVEARYAYAERKRAQLEKRMRERIQITRADIFDLPANYFPPKSVVFVSNLLFPDETNQKLIQFLGSNTSADTIIIVSKVPSNLYKLKLIEKIHVPMSWAANSECYVLGH